MIKKPVRHAERIEVAYNSRHWQQLENLRLKASRILSILTQENLCALTHGSVARGDITPKSDVDVFIPNPTSSFAIEMALERRGIRIERRVIVQATPYYALKGYIEINFKESVSFPLVKMHNVEREFYRFGGEINLELLKKGIRVVGVDKRLMLIEPTERGHVESSIADKQDQVAKRLGISGETVRDRVNALLKRDEQGRTGVFIKRELAPDVTFEKALKKLTEEKPEVRRRLKLLND
jgi:predicted nucleotidyltransferase